MGLVCMGRGSVPRRLKPPSCEPQFDNPEDCPLNCPVQDLTHAIMNSEAVSALIAKSPSLKAAKPKLEAMESGAYVVHRSWGFGQIKRYDEGAQRLIIDFKGKKGHPMDPSFCITTMDVLPAKHLLVRKETEPKVIETLVADNPAQLVVEALQAYPNHAATAIEIEIMLAQVVGEEKFKKWWSVAKKAVAKDPRIAVPARPRSRRRTRSWSSSSARVPRAAASSWRSS
jgi:hypothetical protein